MNGTPKQQKVLVTVEEDDILNIIRAQVKHVLRNDKAIEKLIEEEIGRAVQKKVETAMIFAPIKERSEPMMAAFIAKAIDWRALTKIASTLILDRVAHLLGLDKRTPEQVQKEIDEEIAKVKLDEKGVDKFLHDMKAQGVNRPWTHWNS